MNEYEARQEAKRERYAEMADNARAKSNADYAKADLSESASGIPFGQPILVGHHSERRHRNAIKRADNAMRRAIEFDKKADYYASKAENYGKHGISSDDPDAVSKLKEKLNFLEADQAMMKSVNKILRSKKDVVAKLTALLGSDEAVAKVLKPNCFGEIGFASYKLSNNNANIRRIKDRIKRLNVATSDPVEKSYGDIEYREEDNRVKLIFPSKPPAETRKLLKSNGFRWSPTSGAWQRHRTGAGQYAAQCVLEALQGTA